VRVTGGKVHDVNLLDQIAPEPGAFYVMDRGYLDFERLYRLTQAAAFFVTRTKNNVLLQRRYSHQVDPPEERPAIRLILERFGLLSFFDHVQGTDGFPPKPAPDVIQASLRVFGAAPGDCLFIGDSAAEEALLTSRILRRKVRFLQNAAAGAGRRKRRSESTSAALTPPSTSRNSPPRAQAPSEQEAREKFRGQPPRSGWLITQYKRNRSLL